MHNIPYESIGSKDFKSHITLCMEIESRTPPAMGNFLASLLTAGFFLFIFFNTHKAAKNESQTFQIRKNKPQTDKG